MALTRTLAVTIVLAAAVLVVFWQLTINQRERALRDLSELNEQLQEKLVQREAMVQRLSRTRRLAHVEILGQERQGDTVTRTELLFIELDENGSELARQQLSIPGDVLFIDALTIKFGHEHVAEGHPLHGRSLVLLRRVYSDRMAPVDGIALDTPGAIPPGYASSDSGRYEQGLWELFWDIAGDAELARAMGVRVAQGEAVYKPVRAGEQYELSVDAIGGMNLTPVTAGSSQLSKAE